MGIKTKTDLLREFNEADPLAMFSQKTPAALLDCSEGTMERDRWIGIGIPFVKCGRSVRYRKKDILEYLESLTPASPATEAQQR